VLSSSLSKILSSDVTLNEQVNYFSHPHPQGESLQEDDDVLFIFPDLSFVSENERNEIQKGNTTET